MINLSKGQHGAVEIRPRFPANHISIDPHVFQLISEVQDQLPRHTRIIITRGYESPQSVVGVSRTIGRFAGSKIFKLIYPARIAEVPEIFLPNGHDKDGRHVDLSIMENNRIIKLLPFGVFTPPRIIEKNAQLHADTIGLIEAKFRQVGARFHSNQLERLQMHVDFAPL